MLQFNINKIIINHFICVSVFSIIYYILFLNIKDHLYSEYLDENLFSNGIVDAVYYSINIETTIGYNGDKPKSSFLKMVIIIQLMMTTLITLSGFTFY